MEELIEVRWHGRGGQGAVTAAEVLAESALAEGKHIQAFPEYGPERMGAPVRSFNRISGQPIYIHCQVTNPRVAIVLDPTLLGVVDVSEGVPEDGIIMINTAEAPAAIRKQLNLKGRKLYTVDATSISIAKLGRNIPNTPMIGALVKVTGLITIDGLIKNFRQKYASKFKAEVIEGNVAAIQAAFEQVKGENAKAGK